MNSPFQSSGGSRGRVSRAGAFLLIFVAVLQMAALTACGSGSGATVGAVAEATPTSVRSGNEVSVQLTVIQHNGSVLALVPVFIDGKGPFAFALDTGASNSVIDQTLAQELGLPQSGQVGNITGVTGTTQATTVKVQDWTVGSVTLPPNDLISLDLPGTNRQQGLRGLLGSDMLSQFGAITVDYEAGVLILRSRAGS